MRHQIRGGGMEGWAGHGRARGSQGGAPSVRSVLLQGLLVSRGGPLPWPSPPFSLQAQASLTPPPALAQASLTTLPPPPLPYPPCPGPGLPDNLFRLDLLPDIALEADRMVDKRLSFITRRSGARPRGQAGQAPGLGGRQVRRQARGAGWSGAAPGGQAGQAPRQGTGWTGRPGGQASRQVRTGGAGQTAAGRQVRTGGYAGQQAGQAKGAGQAGCCVLFICV